MKLTTSEQYEIIHNLHRVLWGAEDKFIQLFQVFNNPIPHLMLTYNLTKENAQRIVDERDSLLLEAFLVWLFDKGNIKSIFEEEE